MTSTNGKEIYYFDPARNKEKWNTFNPVKEIKKNNGSYARRLCGRSHQS